MAYYVANIFVDRNEGTMFGELLAIWEIICSVVTANYHQYERCTGVNSGKIPTVLMLACKQSTACSNVFCIVMLMDIVFANSAFSFWNRMCFKSVNIKQLHLTYLKMTLVQTYSPGKKIVFFKFDKVK